MGFFRWPSRRGAWTRTGFRSWTSDRAVCARCRARSVPDVARNGRLGHYDTNGGESDRMPKSVAGHDVQRAGSPGRKYLRRCRAVRSEAAHAGYGLNQRPPLSRQGSTEEARSHHVSVLPHVILLPAASPRMLLVRSFMRRWTDCWRHVRTRFWSVWSWHKWYRPSARYMEPDQRPSCQIRAGCAALLPVNVSTSTTSMKQLFR